MPRILKKLLKNSTGLVICFLLLSTNPCSAEIQPLEDKNLYSLSIYGGRMSDNSVADFADSFYSLDFEESYLVALALTKRVATYRNLTSFEVEAQVVKHFAQQNHWELNALFSIRWETFFWDKYLDTSFAVGIGPSYATNVPEIEV